MLVCNYYCRQQQQEIKSIIFHRFRPVYKAFRNDSSFNFMVFFFVYFVQTCLSVFQAIGMNGSGYCGFITAMSHYGSSAGAVIVGILLTLIAMCFVICAAANIIMITKVNCLLFIN